MQKRKLLRVLLVVVLLLTQTTSFGSSASVPSNVTDTNGNYSDPNNTTLGNSLNSQQPTLDSTANTLANYYINYWKNNSWDWLRRTQFSGSFANGSSPQWAISTIQPFNNIDKSLENVWYGSGSYTANTSTMNLGMGYRQMNNRHSNVYGANLFYDNQFNISDLGNGATSNAMFQRVGLGLEYFTGSIEATVNGYLGISAPVMVANNSSYQTWQNVANGVDVNLKSNFDYFHAPWLNLTLTGYQYFGSTPNSVMANGGQFGGISAQLGWQVTPQLSLNIGQDFGRQTTTAGFNFNLLAAPQPATFLGDQTININATKDLSYKMMQQPQRNNTIAVEQYTKDNGLKFTDQKGQPLANMPVTLTPLSATAAVAAVGSTTFTAVTNVMGMAVFNYITPGDYAVGLPPGYTYLASYITIVAGQPAFAIVATANNPAEYVDIQVDDALGDALTNATVTVENAYIPIINHSGWFTLDNLPAGNYSGTASCAGYADKTFTFYVAKGGREHVWVTLNKAVSSVTVTPSPASVDIGGTQQFIATATYADGTSANVTSSATWNSSNTVATVTSGGLATGVTSGTASITATYGSQTATATLTVNDSVASIAVTPVTASVNAGGTQQYAATATNKSGATSDVTSSATWSSSNTSTATIASGGLATGVAAGSAAITATFGGVSSASANLTVQANPVTSVAVTPVDASINVGAAQQFTATAYYADGTSDDVTNRATWNSSNIAVATVTSGGGLATGVTGGPASITVTYGGKTATATLNVTDYVTSIAVTPVAASVYAGKTQQYTATVTYKSGATIDVTSSATWSSSNTSTATIASGGLASGIAAGSAAITATLGGVLSATVNLTVQANSVTSVAITPVDASINVGATQQFSATANYADGTSANVTSSATWNSSNTAVATVTSGGGLATGVTGGPASITATYGGQTATATLNVTDYVTSIAVTPVAASVYAGKTQQYAAWETYKSGATIDVTISATWSSSNTSAATITSGTSGGLANCVAAGTTVITATIGTISSSVNLTVQANLVTSVEVTPVGASIYPGETQPYFARATYSNGDSEDVTSRATWSSSATGIATIASGGLVSGVAAGTTDITATFDGIPSPAVTLTVKTDSAVSLKITPTTVGGTTHSYQYFTATEVRQSGTEVDVTSIVTWGSTDRNVAIPSSSLPPGTFYCMGIGTARITANLGVLVAPQATLTVTDPIS
ncbi:MAG: Ig-like domain-containing protein [Bacillota bacterium]